MIERATGSVNTGRFVPSQRAALSRRSSEVSEVVDHAERAEHHLAGWKARQCRATDSPVPAQRLDDWLHESACATKDAVSLGGSPSSRREALGRVERLQLSDQLHAIGVVIVCRGDPLTDRLPQGGHVGVDRLLVLRVGHQRPEHDAQRHDQRAGILQERPGSLTGPLEHDGRPRPPPAGEFHHEGLRRAVKRGP
jgi:hypothetical protein